MRSTSRLPVTSAAAAPGLSPWCRAERRSHLRPRKLDHVGFIAGIVLAAAVAAITVLGALVALHLHH